MNESKSEKQEKPIYEARKSCEIAKIRSRGEETPDSEEGRRIAAVVVRLIRRETKIC